MKKLGLGLLAAAVMTIGCKVEVVGQGQFEAPWIVSGATCEQVGAVTVRLVTLSADGKVEMNTDGACQGASGSVTSLPLDVGDYDTHLELIKDDGSVLAMSPTAPGTLVVAGLVVTLPTVSFPFGVDPPTGTGQFRVKWTIDGATCESLGVDAVAVVTTSASGSELHTYNNCVGASGMADSDRLPLGGYRVYARLVKTNDPMVVEDDEVLAASEPGDATLSQPDAIVSVPDVAFTFEAPTGTFQIDWSMVGATCESLGANAIEVEATSAVNPLTVIEIWDCVGMSGTVMNSGLPSGDYTVMVRVAKTGDSGDEEVFAESAPEAATIPADGGTVVLDPVVFDFTPPTPAVTFQIDFGAPGGDNCEKVVQQQIMVTGAADEMCVSFVLGGTDQTGAPFTSDTCGTAALCMETTVVQTIAAVPPGDYKISAFGLKGATGGTPVTCYQVAQLFTVFADDLNLGSLSVPFDPLPADDAACNATKPAPGR